MNRRALPVLLLLAAIAAACGNTTPSSEATEGPAPTPTASPSATPPESPGPDPSSPEPPTEAPGSEEPSAAPTDPGPTDEPTEAPTPDAGVTPVPGPADACTANQEQRDFYVAVSEAVAWPVFCAVLPGRWFVTTGSYRLANGGRMEIGYKGPGEATIQLREGAFCPDVSGCVPPGTDIGPAAFGTLDGTLSALDDGGYAIVVERGAPISHLLVVQGLDQDAAVDIGAALAEVGE